MFCINFNEMLSSFPFSFRIVKCTYFVAGITFYPWSNHCPVSGVHFLHASAALVCLHSFIRFQQIRNSTGSVAVDFVMGEFSFYLSSMITTTVQFELLTNLKYNELLNVAEF